jgi:VWFA-related protein
VVRGAWGARAARRAVAIIVDDLRMSFDGVYRARFGLEQFVDRQFRPGDVAMLTTTSGRADGAREFTFSPIVLKSEVRRLRYGLASPRDKRGMFDGPLASFDRNQDPPTETDAAVRAIGRVSAAVDALKDVPGRRLVILVSEGFSLHANGGGDDVPIREALQRLVDRSNRAGVVVYAIDPRGVVVAGLTADGNTSAEDRQAVVAALRQSQGDLRFVTGQTGGFAVINNNDLGAGFKRIIADQRGYYLIGYQPAPGTIDSAGRTFRKVEVRVKRKGLTVRTRAGFYGIATE